MAKERNLRKNVLRYFILVGVIGALTIVGDYLMQKKRDDGQVYLRQSDARSSYISGLSRNEVKAIEKSMGSIYTDAVNRKMLSFTSRPFNSFYTYSLDLEKNSGLNKTSLEVLSTILDSAGIKWIDIRDSLQ